jgi:hypothetical protein
MRVATLKYFLILCLILFCCLPNYAYQDSTKSKAHNAKYKTISKDSFDNNIRVKNEKSFIERNEGQIFGSFLAGIVALFTVLLTHYLISKKEKLYRENVYCNLLVGIRSDLTVHDFFSGQLHKSLIEIKRITREQKKLIPDSVHSKLSLELINQCRLKLMDFEKTHKEILNKINRYYNYLEVIKKGLDFSAIKSSKDDFESDEEYLNGIDNFFETLLTNIEVLNKSRDELMSLIITELQKFPKYK